VRFILTTLALLMCGACCVIGGPLEDGPELSLCVSATWGGATPPIGSTAAVDIYSMIEGTGQWTPVVLDEPYPIVVATGALVDTFCFDWQVPENGDRMTYRYEVELTIGDQTYSPADYPELVCESGEWWWLFAGRIRCSERER